MGKGKGWGGEGVSGRGKGRRAGREGGRVGKEEGGEEGGGGGRKGERTCEASTVLRKKQRRPPPRLDKEATAIAVPAGNLRASPHRLSPICSPSSHFPPNPIPSPPPSPPPPGRGAHPLRPGGRQRCWEGPPLPLPPPPAAPNGFGTCLVSLSHTVA